MNLIHINGFVVQFSIQNYEVVLRINFFYYIVKYPEQQEAIDREGFEVMRQVSSEIPISNLISRHLTH